MSHGSRKCSQWQHKNEHLNWRKHQKVILSLAPIQADLISMYWITLNRKMLLLNQLSPNNYPEITSWMTHALVSRNKQTSSVLHVQIMQIVGCTTQLIFFRTKAFTQLYWKRNEHQRSRNWGYQFYSLGPKETTGVLTTIDSPLTNGLTKQIIAKN